MPSMTTTPPPKHPAAPCRAALLLGALLAVLPVAGCNIMGTALFLVKGPEKAPAVFTLPKEKTGVVFIDDRSSQAGRAIREAMGTTCEKRLLFNKAATDMVESRGVQAVLTREKDKKLVSITSVGKNLKADFVIYAWIDLFVLTADGQTFAPAATLRVKVVDVATGQRIFPVGVEGLDYYPLKITAPKDSINPPNSVSTQAQSELEFGRFVGQSLAELFYEHIPQGVFKSMEGRQE